MGSNKGGSYIVGSNKAREGSINKLAKKLRNYLYYITLGNIIIMRTRTRLRLITNTYFLPLATPLSLFLATAFT